MIWRLLLSTVAITSLPAQGKPTLEWRLTKPHFDKSAFQPTTGALPLRVGDGPAFYGPESAQCLLRRQADPIATIDKAIPSARLPRQSLTVEAWVAIDVAQEWGGVLGALEDNGEDERGWLLGFRGRKFSFALSSQKKRRLTYLTASSRFVLGQFHHVVGTYNGSKLRLYVDGDLAAETSDQAGPIYYADQHQFVAGAYKDANESYKMQGALQTLRVYESALSPRRIKAIFRKEGEDIPVAAGPTFTAVAKKAYPSLATLQPKINTAIDRGVENVLRQQNRDGSWSYKLSTYRNGATGLAVYALAKSGVPAEHPSIQAALKFLAAKDPVKVYSYGCQLLALAGVGTGSQEHREWARRLTSKLAAMESRAEPGGWAYPQGAVDLSNTQFAALGFFGAAQLGVDVAPEVWRRMVRKTILHQPFLKATAQRRNASGSKTSSDEQQGGYTYFPGGRTYPESGSMTTAGLCILALADRLSKSGLGGRTLRALHRSKGQALRWIDDNFTVTTNPGYPSTTYYYLYGVERVGALLDQQEFGGVPWYRAGAQWLTGKQAKDGSWDRFDQTCFALLFLTRATAPVTGMATRKPEVWTTGGEVQLAATGRVRCSMWIAGFSEAARAEGLHIRRVRYQLNGEDIGSVPGNAKQAWTSESYLSQYRFPTAGPRELTAIVELKSGASLKSPTLKIDADYDVERWMQGNLDAMAPNLLLDTSTQIGGSSAAKDHSPRLALDGLHATAWVCKAGAKTPKLKIGCKRPLRANRLVLFPVDSRMQDAGAHDQVQRVAVTINRRRQEVLCPKSPLAPTVMDLGSTRVIRTIEVQILERSAGNAHKGKAGFSEVALQMIGKKR